MPSMGFTTQEYCLPFSPWKESYNKPRQHIKKQKHHFANKSLCSQSYVFLVVMYRCESWTIKNSEWGRTDAFELGCWRRLLRVPWAARRSNQSILKKSTLNIHWKDYAAAEVPILWPPDSKSQFIRKDPDAGQDWRPKKKWAAEDEMVR